MKIGDAVRFIGFECMPRDPNHDYSSVGIIVQRAFWMREKRFNVIWPDGTFGRGLYAETLEVISESR